jgi:spore germination cell wall hydrolase CwlJ-like protein
MNTEKLTAFALSVAMTGLIGLGIANQTSIARMNSGKAPEVTKIDLKKIKVKKGGSQKYTGKDIDCLAKAMWHEARGEPLEGKIAVGEVILNRTKSESYPKTICKVIKQNGQFSFVENGYIPEIPSKDRNTFKKLALRIVRSKTHDHARGALFFHANYVKPNWGYRITAKIGTHIFYNI